MNITFVVGRYLPDIGGVERHVEYVSRELLDRGHRITIICETDDPAQVEHEVIGGVDVFRYRRVGHGWTQRLARWRFIRRHRMAFDDAQIIHYHDFGVFYSFAPLLTVARPRLARCSYITFHGWEGVFPPRRSAVILRRLCASVVRGNIAVGHYIERWYGTRPSAVIYGAVEEAPAVPVADPVVCFVGRLAGDTGIMTYLKAWPVIARRHPDLSLMICGDGPLSDAVAAEVRTLPSAVMLGFVRRPEEVMAKSRVVLTSGYLSILEALAAGKPTVSTYDNELKRDYLNLMPLPPGSIYAVAGQPDAVADAIERALSEPDVPPMARRFAGKSTWRAVGDVYENLWTGRGQSNGG